MSTRDQVKNIVFTSIATTFGFPKERLVETMDASAIPGWDSVSTSHLLLEIEERMNCDINIAAILETNTIGEIIDVIHLDV